MLFVDYSRIELQSSGHLATERPYTISFLLDFIWLILIMNAFDRTSDAVG
jgi:hypothetical protein